MSKKTLFFATILLCLIIGGAWGYYWYQKPRTILTDIKADYTISAAALYNAFQQNEQQANQKYLGKIITVSGKVDKVQLNGSTMNIQLLSGDEMGGINCSLSLLTNNKTKAPSKGQTILVKGKCTGFLMDVNLVDAIIVS